MSFWKSKVVPKFKKIFFFEKAKKKGALEAVKAFDGSKESFEKEIEEKTPDLHPKILEIYKSSTTFLHKKLLKDPSEAAIKDNPEAVQSVLADLAKAGFPGAETLSGAASKFGLTYLPGPVLFVLQKTSIFLAEETLPEEEKREAPIEETPAAAAEAAPPAEEKKEEATEEKKEEETTITSVKEAVIGETIVVVEAATAPPPPTEEKKEEAAPPPPPPPAAETPPPPPPAEDKKKEEEVPAPPPPSAT